MKSKLVWTEEMQFDADSEGNHVLMDAKAPLGKGKAMTPKELVATGLGGCTAMDVIAHLKKHKQAFEKFEVEVDVTTSTGRTPAVFLEAALTFSVTGPVAKDILLDAVRLNGEQVGEGRPDFTRND